MIAATVICDASFYCAPQQGRYQYRPKGKHAGWAAWIKGDGGLAVKGYGTIKPHPLMTSAKAEMYAALNGIWLAGQYGATHILVRSDCMTVIHAIQGRLKPHNLEFWQSCLKQGELEHLVLTGKHVKGHGSIVDAATWVNDWCDQKAKHAMRQSRKGKICLKIS